MCSFWGQVISSLNFRRLDEDNDNGDDEYLLTKIIINFGNQIDEVPKVYHPYKTLVNIYLHYKLYLILQLN